MESYVFCAWLRAAHFLIMGEFVKMKRLVLCLLVFALAASILAVFSVSAATNVTGDFTGDGKVTSDDAIYLLRHVLFPGDYPISADGDFTGDGKVTSDDAVFLLRHVLFPDDYPIIGPAEESSEPSEESFESGEESSVPEASSEDPSEEPSEEPGEETSEEPDVDYFIFTLLVKIFGI